MNASSSVVVTGAASGIGRAASRLLLGRGVAAAVVGVDRDAGALSRTAAELGARFVPLEGDVRSWSTHLAAADAAEHVAPLGGWVNNAGVDVSGGAHEVTAEDIDQGLLLLQASAMYGSAVAVRRMLPQRRGSIVNIASIQGIVAFPRHYVYGAAKAALSAISRSVAVDYGPFGIRCNTISPGAIDTPMLRRDESAPLDVLLERGAALAPLGRVGTAADVAELVTFLVSPQSSFVSGVEIAIDGGAIARCEQSPPIEL